MARIRTIYQSDMLAVGPTPSTGHHFTIPAGAVNAGQIFHSGVNQILQLHRIQNFNYDFGFDRQDLYQFGGLAAFDRPILAPPRVNASFTYLLANFWNESGLGFVTNGTASAISGFLNKTRDDKNYFLKTSAEGVDAQADGTNDSTVTVLGIGNGFVTNYNFEAAVGDLPRVTIGIEGLNLMFQQGLSGQIPAVNPTDGSRMNGIAYRIPTGVANAGTGNLAVSVLRPGDLFFSIRKRNAEDEGNVTNATGDYDTVGTDLDTAAIQRCSLSFGLSRDVIGKLGNRYGVSREIRFPVPINVTVEALQGDLISGSIFNIVNCDDGYDIDIDMYRPSGCSNVSRYIMAKYQIKNAKLDSQSVTKDIGSNSTVSFSFSSSVGGPSQTGIGIFMSGLSTAGSTQVI